MPSTRVATRMIAIAACVPKRPSLLSNVLQSVLKRFKLYLHVIATAIIPLVVVFLVVLSFLLIKTLSGQFQAVLL